MANRRSEENGSYACRRRPDLQLPVIESDVKESKRFQSRGLPNEARTSGNDRQRRREDERPFKEFSSISNETVIIEEIYLLPQRSVSRKKFHQLAPSAKGDDLYGENQHLRFCGELIARRIFYSEVPHKPSPLSFGKGKADGRVAIKSTSKVGAFGTTTADARRSQREHLPNTQFLHARFSNGPTQSIFPECEVVSGSIALKGNKETATERAPLGATEKENISQKLPQGRAEEKEEREKRSTDVTHSPICFYEDEFIPKELADTRNTKEAENASRNISGQTGGQHLQFRRRQGVCEAADQTAAHRRKTRILKKKFGEDPLNDFTELADTTKEAGNACRNISGQTGGQHLQFRRQGVCQATDQTAAHRRKTRILKKTFGGDLLNDFTELTETKNTKEAENARRNISGQTGAQHLQLRRQGVCEAADQTAAHRRKTRILKKKFGDDPPNDFTELDDTTNTKEAENARRNISGQTGGQHLQFRRRQGVCEAADQTAAHRRKTRILKKKFGDVPLNDDWT